MKSLKSLSLLLAAFTLMTLFAPTPAEAARPRGRGWSSLGVAGFEGGPCWEIWTRKHWLWGWQIVNEPSPCPGATGSIQGGSNTSVVFAEAAAFVRFDAKGSIADTFGDAVSIPLEPSDTYLGPVLTYGKEEASLVELTPDGEKLAAFRIKPEAYPESLRVRESHELSKLFQGPSQAALVTLSEDGTRIEKVHAVIQVEPVK